MDSRVCAVIAIMESNPGRTLTLGKLAQHVNLSPSRLRHIFKEQTGTTLAQYLRILRNQQAKVLLETTFLRVKEISTIVGMRYDVCFVRVFKRYYGLTPAKYRASHEAMEKNGRVSKPLSISVNK
jgi:transcriptional regulator GlxA family with amidase domain